MLLLFLIYYFLFFQQIIEVRTHSDRHKTTQRTSNWMIYNDEDMPEKYVVTHEAWFDISISESKTSTQPIKKERIVIGLFGEICPMTVTNFITITKGLRRSSV